MVRLIDLTVVFHEITKKTSDFDSENRGESFHVFSLLGLVQTSNFSCADPNVNDLSSLFES